MELDSSELLKRFVAADVGVGFIARSNVMEDVKAGVLAAIPMADASLRRDLALVFRKDKALSRAAWLLWKSPGRSSMRPRLQQCKRSAKLLS